MIIRPLIWTRQPAADLSLLETTGSALESVRLFYAAYNCPLTILPPAMESLPPIDLSRDDIWPLVWQQLQSRFRDGESILVLLDDDAPDSYTWGWGGYPLAVLRGSSIRRLRSVGSPDAIVDDGIAIGAIAHEVGHCLGFAHDFTDRNIMSSWWAAYPGLAIPSTAMLEAWSPVGWRADGSTLARLSLARQWIEGCRQEGG